MGNIAILVPAGYLNETTLPGFHASFLRRCRRREVAFAGTINAVEVGSSLNEHPSTADTHDTDTDRFSMYNEPFSHSKYTQIVLPTIRLS